MRLHRLTAKKVQTAKNKGMLCDGGGLWLSVAGDSKSWVFRWMTKGKARSMGLGGWPTVTLDDARKKAADARRLIADDIDPLEAKRAKSAAPAMPTFEQAARLLHKELLPSWANEKHGNDWINSLAMHVFPAIGALPLDKIAPKHVADVLRPIWLDIAETARRVKQRMHAVMAWAWAHGHVSANPVDVVAYLLPKQGDAGRSEHMPAMPWRDVPAWAAKHMKADSVSARALEFLILTACRSQEVRGATWQEFDLEAGTWSIPADRMKTKQPHRVPLAPRVLELLTMQQGQHKTLVFPSVRKGVQLSDMALTAYLRDHSAHSDTPGRAATAHGFRSSFRDWASENGYPRDLAERALAHVIGNKTEAAYHRTDLLELRRPMMAAWAKHFTMPSHNHDFTLSCTHVQD